MGLKCGLKSILEVISTIIVSIDEMGVITRKQKKGDYPSSLFIYVKINLS